MEERFHRERGTTVRQRSANCRLRLIQGGARPKVALAPSCSPSGKGQLRALPGGIPNGAFQESRVSILQGSLWIMVVSLLLLWVPFVNLFVGGCVGGYKVRSAGRALLSALLPIFLTSGCLWVAYRALGFDLVAGGRHVALLTAQLCALSHLTGAAVGSAIGRSRLRTACPSDVS